MKGSAKSFAFLGLFLLTGCTLAFNLIRIGLGQQTLDAAIYQQAILDLAFTSSWNPYNTVRGEWVFLDHFDPILILVAFVQCVIGAGAWVPYAVEYGFYLLGGGFVLWATRSAPFSWRLFGLMAWFSSEGLLGALHYPLHPTTWAMLPLLVLVWALRMELYGLAVVLANVLCAYKEYFPFCSLLLAGGLFLGSHRRAGLTLLLTSILWIGFDFWGRELWIGKIYRHGSGLFSGLDQGWFRFGVGVLRRFDWKGVGFNLFPVVLGGVMVWRQESRPKWIWLSLLYIVPVLAIQVLAGTMGLQYGAPIFAVLLGVLLFSDPAWFLVRQGTGKWVRVFLWITVVYSTADSVLRTRPMLAMLRQNEKREILDQARALVQSEPSGSKILASVGLVPVFLKPDQKIYTLGGYAQPQREYRVLALGRCQEIYSWPHGCEALARIEEKCRPFVEELLMENHYLYLARGRFPFECSQP